MDIVWLGHSCFRLRGSTATVVTDPYASSLGLDLPSLTSSLVTVSNEHPHHNNWQAVQGEPYVIRGPGEFEVSQVFVTGVETSTGQGPDSGVNSIYLIQMDDLSLCHLGDLSHPLSASQIEVLSEADVLFVPTGGGCTQPLTQLAETINRLGPRIIIPMHYRTEGVQVSLDPLDGFLEELGVKAPQTQSRLSVTATSLPPEPKVIILDRTV